MRRNPESEFQMEQTAGEEVGLHWHERPQRKDRMTLWPDTPDDQYQNGVAKRKLFNSSQDSPLLIFQLNSKLRSSWMLKGRSFWNIIGP